MATHDSGGDVLFPAGRPYITPGALAALERSGHCPTEFLARHMAGDWGELGVDDWRLNDHAVTKGARILSAYSTRLGERLWVITEADRSVTTLLLPTEY